MNIIILAAGEGRRLRPLTNNKPKCMVEYRGKQILRRIIDIIKKKGIEEISIVDGYCNDSLRSEYKNEGLNFFYNEEFASSNMVYSLFHAKEKMKEDFIICYSDIVFSTNAFTNIYKSNNPISILVEKNWKKIWKLRMANPLDDAETLKIDKNGFIFEIGKKTKSYEDIQGQYMGLIKVSRNEIDNFISLYEELKNKNFERIKKMFMTEFIQEYINKYNNVKEVAVFNECIEIDTTIDLEIFEKERYNFN